jgi:predicted enzyme related to lactoylglutathione lyase
MIGTETSSLTVRFTVLTLAALVLLGGCVRERPLQEDAVRDPDANGGFPATGDIMTGSPLLGLRTAGYHVADLDSAKRWYTELLGYGPYFDEPFYVGFDVGGYELGLNPDTSRVQQGAGGTVLYWGVTDADAVLARLLELGATEVVGVEDVGGGIRHAIVTDPFGNLFGIIENPNFRGGQ